MRNFVSLILLIFISITTAISQSYPPNGDVYDWTYTEGVGTNWNTSSYKAYIYNRMSFRMMSPVGFDQSDDSKKYPIAIFFHGKGEAGEDNNNQLKWGAKLVKSKIESGEFPGFALYPQNTSGFWNDTHFDRLVEILDTLANRYHVDLNRVYIHGLSAGGQAVWKILDRYPQYFAAAIPLSAASTNFIDFVPNLVHIPIWLAQGGLDNGPAPYTAGQLVEAVQNGGGNIKYSLFPENAHNTWDDMWEDPDYFPFFLRHSKLDIHAYYGKTEFCPGDVISTRIGVSAGFDGYQWAKDGVVINGATNNNYDVTSLGNYTVRILRGDSWSEWSLPIEIKYEDPSETPPVQTLGLQTVALPGLDGKTSVTLVGQEGLTDFKWSKLGSSTVISTEITYEASSAGQYVLTARKIDGCYALSSVPFLVTNGRGASAPSSPANLLLSTLSETSLSMTWDQNPSSVNNETAFEIYRSKSVSGPYTLVKITEQDASQYIDTKLSSNTIYYYRVRAINNDGFSANYASNSASTKADTEAPTIPQNVQAVGSPTAIDLSWDDSQDNVGVYRYEIYQSGVLIATTSNTNFKVLGVQSGNSYTYSIKATDLAGNKSSFSQQVVQIAASNGLNYSYYEEEGMSALPNFSQLSPVKTGVVSNFSLSEKEKNDNFAFKFDGYINIPTTGAYTFGTISDDGSKLYIGGFDPANLVVNNDGLHASQERNGTINLTAGVHPITVTFFEKAGGETLIVNWSGPGLVKQVIPDAAFKSNVVLPPAPAVPAGLAGAAVSYKEIALTWSDVADETGYELYRSSNSGESFEIVATLSANVTSYNDKLKIQPQTTYFYKIKSINQYGASDFGGGSAIPGMTYTYYEKSGMSVLPDFNALTPVKSGPTDNFDISYADAINNFAFKFDGFIIIPVTGDYNFSTRSDDGSKLYIDGFSESNLVVDNDGLHGKRTRDGNITLTAGPHRIVVTFFEGSGGEFLEVKWDGPNFDEEIIPSSAFVKNYIEVTSLALPEIPAIPTDLTAVATSSTETAVSWVDESSNENGFEVYRATGESGEFRLFNELGANVTSFTNSNLFPHLTYKYMIRAFNDGGYSEFTSPISVTTLNTNPQFESLATISLFYDADLEKEILAIDADGDLVSYSVYGSLPPFATFSDNGDGTSNLSINPSLSDIGIYPVSLIANDLFSGADTVSFDININSNNAPEIGVIANQTISEGVTSEVIFDLIEPNNEVITLSAIGLPDFVTVVDNNDGTGSLLIEPKFTDAGVYTGIKVVATDEQGASAERVFSITVHDVVIDHKVFVNFSHSSLGNNPWNNTGKPSAGKVVSNFTNENGLATTYDLEFLDSWSSYILGATTGNNSGVYPDNVIKDFHFFGSYTIHSARLKFKDLDTRLSYDFTFFANSTFGSVQGITNYEINGVSVALDVSSNTQNTVKIAGAKPDENGEILITFSKDPSLRYGYINAIVFESYYDDGLAPTPASITSVNASDEGVVVNWVDNSITEDGYKVYRSDNSAGFVEITALSANEESFIDVSVMGGVAYSYFIHAFNENGTSNSDTLSIVAPNRAPKILPVADLIMDETSPFSMNVSVSDAEGDDIDMSASMLPSFVSISGVVNDVAVLTIFPSVDHIGSYTLQLIATDEFGNTDTKSFQLQIVDSKKKSILVNFNKNNRTLAPSPWNNTLSPVQGAVYNNLIDKSGVATTIDMTLTTGGWTNAETSGAVTGDNSGVYPDLVTGSYYFFQNTTPSIKFSSLNTGKKYNFIFFGSAAYGTNNHETNYTIGAKTVTLNVQNNAYDYVYINGVSPNAQGEVVVSFSKSSVAAYGFINAIEIIELNELDKPLRPEGLKVKAVKRNTVSLNWRDDAHNEYFYEVVRATSLDGPYSSIATLPHNSTSYVDNTVLSNKQYFYKVAAINGEGSSGYSEPISIHTPLFEVFVNVNINAAYNAPAPWNNLERIPNLGDEHYNLLDDQGNNRGIRLAFDEAAFTGGDNFGLTTGNNSGIYPDVVMESFYYLNATEHATWTVGNLLPGYKYRLVLFGAISIGSKNVSLFTVGDKSKGLVTQFNYKNTAILDDLVADENGDIFLEVEAGSLDANWAILNSIIIQGYTDDSYSGARFETYEDQTLMSEELFAYPSVLTNDENLKVSLANFDAELLQIVISDLHGHAVFSKSYNSEMGTAHIETSSLSSGAYLVTATSNNGMPKTARIFKQ